MTPEQIKANAPDGATEYLELNNTIYYYKTDGNKTFFWNKNEWSITYRPINNLLKPL